MEGTKVLIDRMIVHQAANFNKTEKEVRNLARILAEVDPLTFGLLKCRGVIKDQNEQQPTFDFILDIPPGFSSPQSLRTVLLSGKTYPLDERLGLAKRITSSIMFVHTVRFVHKNIRPETIIAFQNEQSEIGTPFLAGFEQFRLEDGNTYRAGDNIWEHNLYRHPSRQGTHPEVDYQMQHDIYSLGVVLLEIGLWTSFVLYDSKEISFPNPILGINDPTTLKKPQREANQNKTKLEELAESELPIRLGRRYTDVVLSCLRCLDRATEKSNGFGADAMNLKDEDGIVIGVRYIENVLERIQEINL